MREEAIIQNFKLFSFSFFINFSPYKYLLIVPNCNNRLMIVKYFRFDFTRLRFDWINKRKGARKKLCISDIYHVITRDNFIKKKNKNNEEKYIKLSSKINKKKRK